MQLREWIAASSRRKWICRSVGLCLFAVAFFLPARTSSLFGILKGWECAWFALALPIAKMMHRYPDDSHFALLLIALSGLVNLLVVAVLALGFSERFLRLRRILAVAILACMTATWTYFAIAKVYPLIGHHLWIAGALLILLPDFLDWRLVPVANRRQEHQAI